MTTTIARLKKKNLRTEDLYSYTRLHLWVSRELGKAYYCSNDSAHKSTRYHWANISGEYRKSLSDWRQLCPSCNVKESITDNFREIKRIQAIGNTNRNTPIVQVDTGKTYPSLKEASIKTGIGRTSISNVLSGLAKTAGGYKWAYARGGVS